MKLRWRSLVGWTILILPFTYAIGSEIYYARSITPDGILTVRDFFDRFGEPRNVRMVQYGGKQYYEFSGRVPSTLLLATPSGPAAYIFDDEGNFVTWCSDPGDAPSHRQAWPLAGDNDLDIPLVRQKFGL